MMRPTARALAAAATMLASGLPGATLARTHTPAAATTPAPVRTPGAIVGLAGDDRLVEHQYIENEVVPIDGRIGVQATIAFENGETIENVAVGDSLAWQITPNKRADLLFVKPLNPLARTNMTVITNRRTYFFDLSASPKARPLYMLRFTYAVPYRPPVPAYQSVPAQAALAPLPAKAAKGRARRAARMREAQIAAGDVATQDIPLTQPEPMAELAPAPAREYAPAPVAAAAPPPAMIAKPAPTPVRKPTPAMIPAPAKVAAAKPAPTPAPAAVKPAPALTASTPSPTPIEGAVDGAALNFAWTRSGTSRLLPARIYDDGASTYMLWSEKAEVPKILVRDSKGYDVQVPYTLQGSTIVLAMVPRTIVLRAGKARAMVENARGGILASPRPPVATYETAGGN